MPTPSGIPLNRQHVLLPDSLRAAVDAASADWQAGRRMARLWARDASLWTGGDEHRWLGWLDIARQERERIAEVVEFARAVAAEGFTDVLLLGMGGSSLAPEVIATTFGPLAGSPQLHVLDSTVPAQVAAFEARLDLARTLVVVASKSGSTLEPNILKQYFFERMGEAVGPANAGRHFVAITDPGSQMQKVAERDGFRHVFFGLPEIGGRFSALSRFGLVPAALAGVDVSRFLETALAMSASCGPDTPVVDNPGALLGLVLGTAATLGRDKLTIFTAPELWDLGAWLEQLVAESTGKRGQAIIPVDLERLRAVADYRHDRVFVHVGWQGSVDASLDAALDGLARAGHPVVRIDVEGAYGLAQELFRWEIATAVAGAVMGIHPFDQPDVEASKVETRALTSAFEQTGVLPQESPIAREGSIAVFADAGNAAALAAAGAAPSVAALLGHHFGRIRGGDYIAVLAYVEMNAEHRRLLQDLRHSVGERTGVATCLGFGPRFLHSTGQAYKGGPGSGVFLQVTSDDALDLAVPGQRYSFGIVKAAQARGDYTVLAERGRRALRIHLGRDVAAGLRDLHGLVVQVLQGSL
jgi:transaldolase/glucose-6-phosphate isomerase